MGRRGSQTVTKAGTRSRIAFRGIARCPNEQFPFCNLQKQKYFINSDTRLPVIGLTLLICNAD